MNSVEQLVERDRALFNRISGKYSQKDLKKASRIARRQRLLQTLLPIQDSETRGGHLLELGCGAGFAADYLNGLFKSFHGVDYSSGLIDVAKKTFSTPDISFEVGDIMTYEIPDSTDVVFMIGVVHHIPEMDRALQHVHREMKSGTYLAINEPCSSNPIISWMRSIRKKSDGDYSEDQEELSEKQIIELMKNAGFVDIIVKRQGYFSTPLAEVVLNPGFVFTPLAHFLTFVDRVLERLNWGIFRWMSWNVIAIGRKG